MTETAAASLAARLGLYAAVAAIVLAYVGVTTGGANNTKPPSAASAVQRVASELGSLTQRLTAAAILVAIWIVVDLAVAAYLRNNDGLTHYLVRVLLGWGMLLALGAMLSAGHQRWLAAAIVFGVTAAFIGLWLAALSTRRRAKATH